MNDHTIYKGTGIQAAKSMIAWLKFALFKAKSSRHILTEEPVCCRHNLKEKSVLSLIIILDDSSCYLMIFMIL